MPSQHRRGLRRLREPPNQSLPELQLRLDNPKQPPPRLDEAQQFKNDPTTEHLIVAGAKRRHCSPHREKNPTKSAQLAEELRRRTLQTSNLRKPNH